MNSLPSTTNSISSAVLGILLGMIIIYVVVEGCRYFFDFDIITYFFRVDPTANSPAPSSSSPSSSSSATVEQVFNIPKNKYTYEDAQAMCRAYNARLATYEEIEESYNRGGEWCSYGWSADQMALFPTQSSTWKKLQQAKGHENDCGRPGVNGGVIKNSSAKFGVNCYGVKPDMNEREQEKLLSASLYPKTTEDIEYDKKTSYWKDHLDDILVSPFNKTKWSII